MESSKPKLIRTSTIPLSLNVLLKGQLRFLNQHFEVLAVSGGGSDLEELASREDVRTTVVEMQRKISPLRDLVSLWQLFWLFRKEKPQIVHSITPKAGLLTMLAGKLAGVPIRMHTFTGLIFPTATGLQKKILIWMDRLLVYCATHVYPEGKGVKRDLLKYDIVNKRVKVLGNGNVNGIDLEHFHPESVSLEERDALRNKLDIVEDNFVYCFVGRLVKDKGANELVQAFSKIQRFTDSQKVKLLLVGPYEDELDPLLPEVRLEIASNPDIITVGFQQDVRAYFAISNVFVLPSYREGFPNAVLQAGAMGLPSIVTDINGSKEIIFNGLNGTIVPTRNKNALSQAMKELLNDHGKVDKMQFHARPLISSRYEQSLVWHALLKEYKLALTRDT